MEEPCLRQLREEISEAILRMDVKTLEKLRRFIDEILPEQKSEGGEQG